MSPDERDRLLDLHRKSVNMMAAGDVTQFTAADDAFRDFLFSLEVSA